MKFSKSPSWPVDLARTLPPKSAKKSRKKK
jgi:hypothetical protein